MTQRNPVVLPKRSTKLASDNIKQHLARNGAGQSKENGREKNGVIQTGNKERQTSRRGSEEAVKKVVKKAGADGTKKDEAEPTPTLTEKQKILLLLVRNAFKWNIAYSCNTKVSHRGQL